MRLPQFTIRDLMWLMVVVALAFGWFADNRSARQAITTDTKDLLHRDVVLDVVEGMLSDPNTDKGQISDYLKSSRYEVFDVNADALVPVPRRSK
jgi:lipopolysaccharide biosynthesis regulator YciM